MDRAYVPEVDDSSTTIEEDDVNNDEDDEENLAVVIPITIGDDIQELIREHPLISHLKDVDKVFRINSR